VPVDRSDPFLVESLVTLGRVDEAEAVVETMQERHRLLPRTWLATTLPRARALVLATRGGLDDALAVLAEPPAVAGQLPFDLAWHRLVHGRLLRRAKRRGASSLELAAARDAFRSLGAATWAELAGDELARVGIRQPATPTQSGLTPSEQRVATLVATGMTNREIAAAVFMSPKTVEANLTRVYRKLGVRSRAELVSRLQRSGGT
jgi:DNA-binding CsgD family transcriptional regulator